jgi:hypothetical protein
MHLEGAVMSKIKEIFTNWNTFMPVPVVILLGCVIVLAAGQVFGMMLYYSLFKTEQMITAQQMSTSFEAATIIKPQIERCTDVNGTWVWDMYENGNIVGRCIIEMDPVKIESEINEMRGTL